MASSSIRHLAAARDIPRVAAGEFENTVSIWDTSTRAELSRFETVLDFGGRRLALSCSGERCYAAAYHVHGIVCYDVLTGSEVWTRRDLKRVQSIKLSSSCHELFCYIEGMSFLVLSADAGAEKSRHRGVSGLHESVFSALRVVETRELEFRDSSWRKMGSLPRSSFATLDVAFSKDLVAISESGAGVRFVSASNLREVADYKPPAGHHVLSLAYSAPADRFFGVEWHYEAGGPKRLLTFTSPGRAEVTALLGGSFETVFVNDAREVLTSEGVLFSTSSGETIGRLPFPIDSNVG